MSLAWDLLILICLKDVHLEIFCRKGKCVSEAWKTDDSLMHQLIH